jgi:hypothetical protein
MNIFENEWIKGSFWGFSLLLILFFLFNIYKYLRSNYIFKDKTNNLFEEFCITLTIISLSCYFLKDLLQTFLPIFLIFVPFILFCMILFKFKWKINEFALLGILVVSLFFGYRFQEIAIGYVEKPIPNAFFEKSAYDGMFYVNAFPKENNSINYRVPALIHSYIETHSDPDDKTHSFRIYDLQYLEFPNRGKVYFDDGSSLKLNQLVHCLDGGGREWNIELTDTPVR